MRVVETAGLSLNQISEVLMLLVKVAVVLTLFAVAGCAADQGVADIDSGQTYQTLPNGNSAPIYHTDFGDYYNDNGATHAVHGR